MTHEKFNIVKRMIHDAGGFGFNNDAGGFL